jgi:hypothetical protein
MENVTQMANASDKAQLIQVARLQLYRCTPASHTYTRARAHTSAGGWTGARCARCCGRAGCEKKIGMRLRHKQCSQCRARCAFRSCTHISHTHHLPRARCLCETTCLYCCRLARTFVASAWSMESWDACILTKRVNLPMQTFARRESTFSCKRSHEESQPSKSCVSSHADSQPSESCVIRTVVLPRSVAVGSK